MVRSKIYRSVKFQTSDARTRFACEVNVAAEALDHLLQRVQVESEKGGILYTLLRDDTNVFMQAQMTLVAIVSQLVCGTSMAHLLRYSASTPEDMVVFGGEVFQIVLTSRSMRCTRRQLVAGTPA